MKQIRFLRRFAADRSASMLVEFALLGPVLMTMMIGIFQVGVYLQNYNAIRSIASDAGRYVMIEYQKGNNVTDNDIRSVILGRAVNTPYMLDTDRLQITAVTQGTSRVAGAKEIDVDITYTLEDFLPFVTLPGTTLTYSRPIFVVTN